MFEFFARWTFAKAIRLNLSDFNQQLISWCISSDKIENFNEEKGKKLSFPPPKKNSKHTIVFPSESIQIKVIVEYVKLNNRAKTKWQFNPIIILKKQRVKFQLFNLEHQ